MKLTDYLNSNRGRELVVTYSAGLIVLVTLGLIVAMSLGCLAWKDFPPGVQTLLLCMLGATLGAGILHSTTNTPPNGQ